MQTRLEAQTIMAQYLSGARVSLNRAEKAVVEWAMVDDYQAVLDLSCSRDNLLSHYLSHYQLRACGLCFDIASARELRAGLDHAEIMSAMGADIPWQEDSFDRVLMTSFVPSYVSMDELFSEVFRVLKPGGRFVAAISAFPGCGSFYTMRLDAELMMSYLKKMEDIGFINVAYNKTRFGSRCLIAHKEL